MTQRLFANFLDSAEQYKASERYWEQLARDVANSLGQVDWQRWIPRHNPDGTPVERDGNPIFDGRSQELNRAFRVIQHPPVGDELELVAWLQSYEEEYADLPRAELIINLSLSEESAQLANTLLRKWMTPTTTKDEMQVFLREILAPRNPG